MTKSAYSVTVLPPPQTTRLLVIEPEGSLPRLRDLVDHLFGKGFRIIHEISSITDATALLEREKVDLVLADIGREGLHSMSLLAQQPELGSYVPFIVIDHAPREEVALHALHLGAQDYLVKGKLTPPRLERAMRWAVERAKLEREFKKDSDLLHALLEYVPDKIYFKDRHSRFLKVSRSVSEWLKAESPEALVGKSDFNYYTAEHADATFADEQRIIETARPIVGKVSHRTMPDGRAEWSSTTKLPLRDRNGRIVGTFGVTRDLTELKILEIELAAERNRLQEANKEVSAALEKVRLANEELQAVQLQLIEAEKLKSIGRLAAGVAHEVKNPHAIISMGVEYLAGKYKDDAATAEVLKELGEAVLRADGVIKGLLDFSAPQRMEVAPQDLNSIIRAALQLVRGEVHHDVHQVEVELEEIPDVIVDRAKMNQVFVNLFSNALQAMAEGGTLTVRTRSAVVTGLRESQNAEQAEVFQAGDQIVIAEVADTGPGLRPELLERVFDPFFTTKPAGKGTGLGMSVVRSIMNLHRGTVTIGNRETGGAIVTLTFKAKDTP